MMLLRPKTQHQNEPKQLFPINRSGSTLFFLLLGVILMLSFISGCSSGATPSTYAPQAARPTKTWTPLPTLTPLATYTPSVTPLPAEPLAPVTLHATRMPAPTIPPMAPSDLLSVINSRRRVEAPGAVNPEPSFEFDSEFGTAIGGYEGEATECCRWPVTGRITSDVTPNHIALDIATSLGTPVLAADGGRVVAAGWDNSGYGYRVIVNHGQGLQTLYAHLSDYPVELRDEVKQGQMIGRIGSTGNSTGPHLHFEVRYYGNRMNPWDFLP